MHILFITSSLHVLTENDLSQVRVLIGPCAMTTVSLLQCCVCPGPVRCPRHVTASLFSSCVSGRISMLRRATSQGYCRSQGTRGRCMRAGIVFVSTRCSYPKAADVASSSLVRRSAVRVSASAPTTIPSCCLDMGQCQCSLQYLIFACRPIPSCSCRMLDLTVTSDRSVPRACLASSIMSGTRSANQAVRRDRVFT